VVVLASFLAGAGVFAGFLGVVAILVAMWPVMLSVFTLNVLGIFHLIAAHAMGWLVDVFLLWPGVLMSGLLGVVQACLQVRALRRGEVPGWALWRFPASSLVAWVGIPAMFLGLATWKAIPGIVIALFIPWALSGVLFDRYWQGWFDDLLYAWVGSAVWVRRAVALSTLLQSDSYLYGCIIGDVGVTPDGSTAYVRGWFCSPDQVERVHQVVRRVVGIHSAEVEPLSWSLREAAWEHYLAVQREHALINR